MSVADRAPAGHVGRVMRRKEDPRLITGEARYVDDISLPGQLWAAIVRSPQAHAEIVSIDTAAAAARDGIHAVFTGEDMSDLGGPLPLAFAPPGVVINNPDHWPLARGADDRGDPRPAGSRAGDGSARDPPQELHSEGGLPRRDGDRGDLRSRRLSRDA